MTANIGDMDSPRSGFRRASAASWMLTALGVAGVAGASTLAYAETYKPPVTDEPAYVMDELAPELPPAVPIPEVPPPPPGVLATTIDVPPPPPPPVSTAAPSPKYTPQNTPDYTQEPAPAPAPQQDPAPVSKKPPPPTATARRRLTPVTVMSPKASPRVTASHGS